MADSDIQSQSNYKYTPSSSQSTRQILESTSPTNTPHIPLTSRPSKSSSSNYADADARARAAITQFTQTQNNDSESGRNKMDDKNPTSAGVSSVNWRPKVGRKQSWSQQDLKREMQMSVVMDEGAGLGHGFTETENKRNP